MDICKYIEELTGQIYKALPLRQQHKVNVEFLKQHMNSIYLEANGFQIAHPELKDDTQFQTVINIAASLGEIDVTDEQWKRQILKATNLLNKIGKRYGGDNYGG